MVAMLMNVFPEIGLDKKKLESSYGMQTKGKKRKKNRAWNLKKENLQGKENGQKRGKKRIFRKMYWWQKKRNYGTRKGGGGSNTVLFSFYNFFNCSKLLGIHNKPVL